jgi:hypothetical protein
MATPITSSTTTMTAIMIKLFMTILPALLKGARTRRADWPGEGPVIFCRDQHAGEHSRGQDRPGSIHATTPATRRLVSDGITRGRAFRVDPGSGRTILPRAHRRSFPRLPCGHCCVQEKTDPTRTRTFDTDAANRVRSNIFDSTTRFSFRA